MTAASWLGRLPVISSLSPADAAAKLREIGEDDFADALVADCGGDLATYQMRHLRFWIGRDRAWLHTAHAVGYLAPVSAQAAGLLPIRHASG